MVFSGKKKCESEYAKSVILWACRIATCYVARETAKFFAVYTAKTQREKSICACIPAVNPLRRLRDARNVHFRQNLTPKPLFACVFKKKVLRYIGKNIYRRQTQMNNEEKNGNSSPEPLKCRNCICLCIIAFAQCSKRKFSEIVADEWCFPKRRRNEKANTRNL